MSDDNMKNRLASLQMLNQLATGMGDYSDPMADIEPDEFEASFGGYSQLGIGGLPNISEEDILREMNGGFGMESMLNGIDTPDEMSGFDTAILGMAGMSGMPGMGAFQTGAKEVGVYDNVVVHGMRGNYYLSFEETEEGLEITIKK